MKPEEIPVLQLPAEVAKTQKAAIMDMNNKEMMPWKGPQAPNPSHAACGAKGSSASSRAGVASSSARGQDTSQAAQLEKSRKNQADK